MVNKTSDTVTVIIPRRYPGDKRRYVSVGGQAMSILTGKPVELPRAVARVLRQSEEQREAYERLLEKLKQASV